MFRHGFMKTRLLNIKYCVVITCHHVQENPFAQFNTNGIINHVTQRFLWLRTPLRISLFLVSASSKHLGMVPTLCCASRPNKRQL
jgi:hypothetical protein